MNDEQMQKPVSRAEAKRAWRQRECDRSDLRSEWTPPPKTEKSTRAVIAIGTPKIRMERPTPRDVRRGSATGHRLVARGETFFRADAKPWQTPKAHQS